MQRSLAVFIATLSTLVSSIALADLGPPPTCPPGTYHVYRYGHKCVPNGSHLEADPEGGLKIVPDGASLAKPTGTVRPKPQVPPAPAPDLPDLVAATPSAAASSSAAAPVESAAPPPLAVPSAKPEAVPTNPEPVPSAAPAPEPQRGCACGIPGAPEERIGFGMVIAAMVFAVGRRNRKNRESSRKVAP